MKKNKYPGLLIAVEGLDGSGLSTQANRIVNFFRQNGENAYLTKEPTDNRIRVIIAGLDTDFRGEEFGPMPSLLAHAERADKLHAICMVCGNTALRTQRLVDREPANYNDPLSSVPASSMKRAVGNIMKFRESLVKICQKR